MTKAQRRRYIGQRAHDIVAELIDSYLARDFGDADLDDIDYAEIDKLDARLRKIRDYHEGLGVPVPPEPPVEEWDEERVRAYVEERLRETGWYTDCDPRLICYRNEPGSKSVWTISAFERDDQGESVSDSERVLYLWPSKRLEGVDA